MTQLVSPLTFPDGSQQITAAQTSLWKKAVYFWRPTTVTAGLWVGTVGSGNGTYTIGLPAAPGSIYAGLRRGVYSNVVTTANQTLGQRNTEQIFFIGNVAGKGGFFYESVWGFNTWTNGGRLFAGMSLTTNNVVGVEPSTNPNTIGFEVDAADNGAIYFLVRNSTTATRQATGLTVASSVAFDCRFFCAPNGTQIDWYIKNLETGVEVTGSVNTNLPGPTAMFTCAVLASNAALTTVNAIQLGISRIYAESTY